MIHIVWDEKKHSLTASGHAGYATAGQDIVCAGVSALINAALIRGTEDFDVQAEIRTQGEIHLRFYPEPKRADACREMLLTVMHGLDSIEKQYPEHVTVERR